MASKILKAKKGKVSNSATEILFNRYIKGKPHREKSYRRTLAEMTLGEYIRDQRERMEITQQQLADAIGTKRSAISRLESADYDGHSMTLLCKIAEALNGKLVVRIETKANNEDNCELVMAGG